MLRPPPAASASFNCTMSVTWLRSATRSLGEHGSNLTLIVDLSIGLGCASTIIGGRRRCPSIEQRGGGKVGGKSASSSSSPLRPLQVPHRPVKEVPHRTGEQTTPRAPPGTARRGSFAQRAA